MSTLQHITLEEVKIACLKAFSEKRLAAQNGDLYYYKNGNLGCAIGVALTHKSADLIDQSGWTLRDRPGELRACFTWDEKDYEGLVAIQIAHDDWQSTCDDSREAKNSFLRLLA